MTEEQWEALSEQDRGDHLTGRGIRENIERGVLEFWVFGGGHAFAVKAEPKKSDAAIQTAA